MRLLAGVDYKLPGQYRSRSLPCDILCSTTLFTTQSAMQWANNWSTCCQQPRLRMVLVGMLACCLTTNHNNPTMCLATIVSNSRRVVLCMHAYKYSTEHCACMFAHQVQQRAAAHACRSMLCVSAGHLSGHMHPQRSTLQAKPVRERAQIRTIAPTKALKASGSKGKSKANLYWR